MCKFTYLAFFYYAPFFVLQYPLTVCIEPLNFTLPSSKVQATFKQENRHTLTVCIFDSPPSQNQISLNAKIPPLKLCNTNNFL